MEKSLRKSDTEYLAEFRACTGRTAAVITPGACLYRRQHLRPCDPHLFNQPWQHAGQQNQPACVQAGQGGNAV